MAPGWDATPEVHLLGGIESFPNSNPFLTRFSMRVPLVPTLHPERPSNLTGYLELPCPLASS